MINATLCPVYVSGNVVSQSSATMLHGSTFLQFSSNSNAKCTTKILFHKLKVVSVLTWQSSGMFQQRTVTVLLCIFVMDMQGKVVRRSSEISDSSLCLLECYGEFIHSCNDQRCSAVCASGSGVSLLGY